MGLFEVCGLGSVGWVAVSPSLRVATIQSLVLAQTVAQILHPTRVLNLLVLLVVRHEPQLAP